MKHCLKEIADSSGQQHHLHGETLQPVRRVQAVISTSACSRDGANAFPGDDQLGPVVGIGCVSSFPGWLDGAPARDSWCSMRRPSIHISAMKTAPGRRRASLGVMIIARPAFASLARARVLRIECRVPGADCNPYLAYAAALASGLDGHRRIRLSRPIYSRAISTRRDICRACPIRWSKRSTVLRGRRCLRKRGFGADVVEHLQSFLPYRGGELSAAP